KMHPPDCCIPSPAAVSCKHSQPAFGRGRSKEARTVSFEEPSGQPQPSGAAPHLNSYPVVGVGGSVGGLEAFIQLLQHLPPNPGVVFLFVQPLEPTRPSMLDQVIGRATNLAVRQAQEGMHLEVDHVFLIPPDKDMAVEKGVLKLSPRSGKHAAHMPVDHLFRS